MACPHVSGGAALILEANPSMKSSAVLQQMLDDAYLNVLSDLRFGDALMEHVVLPGFPKLAPASPVRNKNRRRLHATMMRGCGTWSASSRFAKQRA